MASDYSKVSSKALIELKADLTHLSESLHEIYDLMNADMSQVGEYWEDPKYAEFVSGYQPQIAKCEEISERYSEWCKRVLDLTIEKVIAIETTDVGGDGGSSGGGVASTASVSDGGAATSGRDNNFGFNLGGNGPKTSERPLPPPQENIRRTPYDPGKLERPRPPQYQAWPYYQQKPHLNQNDSSSQSATPVPLKPDDSGFETPQNERPHLTPEEIQRIIDGRGR